VGPARGVDISSVINEKSDKVCEAFSAGNLQRKPTNFVFVLSGIGIRLQIDHQSPAL